MFGLCAGCPTKISLAKILVDILRKYELANIG
jgi:hypothetical protein